MNRILLTFASCLLICGSAQALSTDPMIEGAKQCTRFLPRLERANGIPEHLLSAISSTESGRWHSGLRIAIPWPWTANVEGKGYFYESKQEAIAAIRKFQAQGIRSIDVGCMQVNLMHHPGAFKNLEDAFNPESNVAYAATFLKQLYASEGSWKKAAAAYHSKTAPRGAQYLSLVYDRWGKIIDKVKGARLATTSLASSEKEASSLTPTALASLGTPNTASTQTGEGKPKEAAVAQQRLPEQVGRRVASREAPRMKMIMVSNRPVIDNSMMIVSPKIDMPAVEEPKPNVQLASVKMPVTDAKVVRISDVRVSNRRTGPNFIFSD